MNLRESIINGIIFWKRRLLAALLLRNEIRKFNKLGYTLISDGTSLIKHALNLGEQLRFEFMIHGRGGGFSEKGASVLDYHQQPAAPAACKF